MLGDYLGARPDQTFDRVSYSIGLGFASATRAQHDGVPVVHLAWLAGIGD
jgi:hypothetical protein